MADREKQSDSSKQKTTNPIVKKLQPVVATTSKKEGKASSSSDPEVNALSKKLNSVIGKLNATSQKADTSQKQIGETQDTVNKVNTKADNTSKELEKLIKKVNTLEALIPIRLNTTPAVNVPNTSRPILREDRIWYDEKSQLVYFWDSERNKYLSSFIEVVSCSHESGSVPIKQQNLGYTLTAPATLIGIECEGCMTYIDTTSVKSSDKESTYNGYAYLGVHGECYKVQIVDGISKDFTLNKDYAEKKRVGYGVSMVPEESSDDNSVFTVTRCKLYFKYRPKTTLTSNKPWNLPYEFGGTTGESDLEKAFKNYKEKLAAEYGVGEGESITAFSDHVEITDEDGNKTSKPLKEDEEESSSDSESSESEDSSSSSSESSESSTTSKTSKLGKGYLT